MRRRTLLCSALPSLGLGDAWAAATPLPGLIARYKPSLVVVGTYSETDSPRFQFHGTGFAVGDGNAVVTNAHVLPEAANADVDVQRQVAILTRAPDGKWVQRAVVDQTLDRAHDLVVLRFDGPALPTLPLAADILPPEGAQIFLMGFPLGAALGFSVVTHHGIVSSVVPIALPAPGADGLNARAVRQLREGSFEILQLDAVCYPGNSGGPVIDADTGAVIGIVNMVLVKGSRETALSQPTGISYAIPVSYVRALLSH
ncbi:MAG: trypsin-like peptidase domain-containing protein [Paucibacter sp.]|nr:trypsin-like peptidase domain-containing protein [Roseateles sp.]